MKLTRLSASFTDRSLGAVVALACALLALAAPPLTHAQEVDLEALDSWIGALMDDWSTPGLAVGIVYGDSLVFARGYGVRQAGGIRG